VCRSNSFHDDLEKNQSLFEIDMKTTTNITSYVLWFGSVPSKVMIGATVVRLTVYMALRVELDTYVRRVLSMLEVPVDGTITRPWN
jgi:hypothetical protein